MIRDRGSKSMQHFWSDSSGIIGCRYDWYQDIFDQLLVWRCMSTSRGSDSTPNSRRVPLCVDNNKGEVRKVQEFLHTATPVVIVYDEFVYHQQELYSLT